MISDDVLDFDCSMSHESGHLFGLDDLYTKYGAIDRSSDNPMAYPNSLRAMILPGSWGDQREGSFNAKQVRTMINAIKNNQHNYYGSVDKKIRKRLRQNEKE